MPPSSLLLLRMLLLLQQQLQVMPMTLAAVTNIPPRSLFSQKKLHSFSKAFMLLDHNLNGRVTLAEAARGLSALQSVKAAARSPRELAVPAPLPIDPYLCVPDTEPVAFVDCVSSRARQAAANGTNPGAALHLQTELDALYGRLDDVAPDGASKRTCDEVVDAHLESCEGLLRSGFCRLTCRHHAHNYFMAKGYSIAAQNASRRRTQVAGPSLRDPDAYARVLLSSDWHLEPWYDTTGSGIVDGDLRISRFNWSDATRGTFGTCRVGTGASAVTDRDCRTTALHDPPLAFGRSHFEAFAAVFQDCCQHSVRSHRQNRSRVDSNMAMGSDAVARGVLFMLGDGQAHEFHQPFFSMSNAEAVSTHVRSLLRMAKETFAADRIFWTAGNNDGPHSTIFVQQTRASADKQLQINAESEAWADELVAEGIVTNVQPRRYNFVLESEPGCVDDAQGYLQRANTSCAAAVASVADMRVPDGYDACDCSINDREGMSSSGCAVGKNTNPIETIECACYRPFDDPEERAFMNDGVSVQVDELKTPTAPMHTAAAGWRDPQRCLDPDGDGDGCVRLVEVCPGFCNDCFVPRVSINETGLSPTAFFRRTGYYLKQLDQDDTLGLYRAKLYVIVLNTNLGSANAQQTAALHADLAWVQQQQGAVYLLGHHPHVMSNPALVPEGTPIVRHLPCSQREKL